jgi:hypothetical protein
MRYLFDSLKFCGVSFFLLAMAWTSLLGAQTPIRITFAADEVGQLPSSWQSRDGQAGEIYSVRAEAGKKFLHADAKGVAIQIGYESKWPLKEYPRLRWRWRPILFPSNTDERKKDGGDSVLGLYVVFGRWPFIKSIKYIWSDTLPVGASFNSPFSKSAKIIVLRSGRTAIGTWLEETRDVLDDYQRLFGERDDTIVAEGIAILTDADNTNSHAIGDYADMEALAPADKNRTSP